LRSSFLFFLKLGHYFANEVNKEMTKRIRNTKLETRDQLERKKKKKKQKKKKKKRKKKKKKKKKKKRKKKKKKKSRRK